MPYGTSVSGSSCVIMYLLQSTYCWDNASDIGNLIGIFGKSIPNHTNDTMLYHISIPYIDNKMTM